jgi:N-acetylmuramoyl-L-alanine amidase
MALPHMKSTNFDERRGTKKPSFIILHYTGMNSFKAALDHLCDPKSKVSSHYLIDLAGRLYPLVDEQHRAWHAGASFWDGIVDMNSHSIGIEITNPGHEFGYQEFPDKQIEAVIELCLGLIQKYKIKSYNVLGHSDIAPRRKQDPGELFPWEHLATEFVGLWASSREMDFTAAKKLLDDRSVFHDHLVEYGYDPKTPFEASVVAFHRHFYPEKFKGDEDPEEIDLLSAARLQALCRLKKTVKT